MANELTINASMAYEDSEGTIDAGFSVVDLLVTVATKRYVKFKMNVAITEEAIPLGDVGTLGYAMFINRDATNFIELRVGTGGTKFCKLKAGEVALFRIGSGITAPYAIADTGTCQMDVIIFTT